jgi:hypothetical protein
MRSNLEFRPGEFYFVKTGPLKGRVGRGASDNGQPSAKLAFPGVEKLISFYGSMGSVRRTTQAEVDQFLKQHGNHF